MKFLALFVMSALSFRTLDYMLLYDEKKPPPPCSASEARQFDFWLGDWELSWTDKDGNAKKGSNRVSKLFGECNIKEEFSDAKGEFKGTSVSTYIPFEKKWKQTWVDNNGAYLDFAGEYKDGKMILSRKAQRDGKEYLQRMIFYDIAKNSLSWNWERSDDGGKSWAVVWKISYSRKGKA
jgi:hypothetical protein